MRNLLITLLFVGRVMSCPGPEYNTYILHEGESVRALYAAEGGNTTDDDCFKEFCADIYRESTSAGYPNRHIVLEDDTLRAVSGGFVEVPNLNGDSYPGNEEFYLKKLSSK